jgi:hypothetical protein
MTNADIRQPTTAHDRAQHCYDATIWHYINARRLDEEARAEIISHIEYEIGQALKEQESRLTPTAADAIYLASDWIAFVMRHPRRLADDDTIRNGRNILDMLKIAHDQHPTQTSPEPAESHSGVIYQASRPAVEVAMAHMAQDAARQAIYSLAFDIDHLIESEMIKGLADKDRTIRTLESDLAESRACWKTQYDTIAQLQAARDEQAAAIERLEAEILARIELSQKQDTQIARMRAEAAEVARIGLAERDRADKLASELAKVQREYYTSDQTRPALLAEIERLRIELTAAQRQIGFSEAERRDMFVTAERTRQAADKLESILADSRELAQAAGAALPALVENLTIGAETQRRRIELKLLGASDEEITAYEGRTHDAAIHAAKKGGSLDYVQAGYYAPKGRQPAQTEGPAEWPIYSPAQVRLALRRILDNPAMLNMANLGYPRLTIESIISGEKDIPDTLARHMGFIPGDDGTYTRIG